MIALTPMLAVSFIGALCIACQWVAWRFRLPAIVLLSVAGLALGPVTGLLDPKALFGSYMPTLISAAVAIILFDGGLNLRFKELKETRRAVLGMVFVGAPLGWALAAMAAHHVAGLSWPVAAVLGGILVVTGPTVILPLLRQARLQPRAAAVLKWEGIVNDPLGALFAVIAVEYIASPAMQASPLLGLGGLLVKIALLVVASFGIGKAIETVFHRGWMPPFLTQPFVLVLVILTYALAGAFQDEGGLVAVTVLGMTLANGDLHNLEEMRRFKEYLSLLLVSLVFILITATLQWQDMATLDWRAFAFVITLLVIVRPITVLSSTIRSGMTRQEVMFVGWIAPRGVVCAAVSGLFGPKLVALGYADGARMVPLAFLIVFATVVGHGFTLRPWGRQLGLVHDSMRGLLLVGCNIFTVQLAEKLKELGIPVLIADRSWHELRLARQAGLPLYHGEVLSEDAELALETERFGSLLAATDNPEYNALTAERFAHLFGHAHVARLAVNSAKADTNKATKAHAQLPTLLPDIDHDAVLALLQAGWRIKSTRITEEFGFEQYREHCAGNLWPLAIVGPKSFELASRGEIKPGVSLVALVGPAEAQIADREAADAVADA